MSNKAFILPRDPYVRSARICAVVDHLEDLPIDKSWRVSVEAAKSERSLQQNKYLFGVAYDRISKATGWEKQDIHDECLKQHFGVRLKKVPKCKDYPEGLKEVPVRTTTTDEHGRRCVLGKMQFAEFVDFVIRWAMNNVQVYMPVPGEDAPDESEARAA